MNRHHERPRPPAGPDLDRPATDQPLADRLAIDGEARPELWFAAPAPQPGGLSPDLARQLLDRYTQAGDAVLDVDDDPAFAAAAAAAGRYHHALGGALHLAAMTHAAGYLDLILLHWPRPAVNPHWLLRGCRSLLGVAGSLVVAVSADQRVAHLNRVAGVAATAGLHTTRHVAVFDPEAATPVAAADTRRGRHRSPHPRRTVVKPEAAVAAEPHTDLLIFGLEAATDE